MPRASLFFVLTAPASLLFSFTQAEAATLSLAEYLKQARDKSPAVQSAIHRAMGGREAAAEGQLQYIPRLTFNGELRRDEQEYVSNFFGGKMRSNSMTFGLEKQFDFGLKAALTHSLLNSTTTDLTPLVFPGGVNAYSSALNRLELTQPLWRNSFGKETRASEASLEAAQLKIHYEEMFKLRRYLAEAETAYYRLSISRESVKLLRDVLERSGKVLEWNTRRVNRNLADRVDLLQAKAAYQAHQLDLETGLTDEHSATLVFNAYRDMVASDVPEELTPVSSKDLLALQAPKRAEKSDDLKASEQNERLNVANNELALQRAQPDLSLYTTIAYNGIDRYRSPAFSEALTSNHPQYVLGVRLSVPLYFGETAEIRSGRVRQQLAAEAETRQKRISEDQAWTDLSRRLEEMKSRLKLADDLVRAQADKLDYERYRFNLGRTTTYQVLVFETDYSQALLARLRYAQDILSIYSQLKTYAEGTLQ